MAEQVGIRVEVSIPGLEQIQKDFLQFGKYMSARYMAAGLKRAVERGGTVNVLKNLTPKGQTGNLRRAVAIKSKIYLNTGTGIAIVGYRSGRKWKEPYDPTKLGYHQGLVEFGTKQRYRRAAGGLRVSTGKMPVGGSRGRPPVRTAWEMTRAAVESNMLRALQESFDNAAKDLAYKVQSAQRSF